MMRSKALMVLVRQQGCTKEGINLGYGISAGRCGEGQSEALDSRLDHEAEGQPWVHRAGLQRKVTVGLRDQGQEQKESLTCDCQEALS